MNHQRIQNLRRAHCRVPGQAHTPALPPIANCGFLFRRPIAKREDIAIDIRVCPAAGGKWMAEATWDSFVVPRGDGSWPGPTSALNDTPTDAVSAAADAALRQIAAQVGIGGELEGARAWSADAVHEMRLNDQTLPGHGLRVADLAAGGVGGWGLGFTLIGARVGLACEIDPEARRIYAQNVRPDEFWPDLTTLPASKLQGFDVITLGLDCRSISRSGKADGFAARAALYDATIRLLRSADAKLILIECSPDLLLPKHFADAERVRCALRAAGYRVQQQVLDASMFGVPQVRARSFMVATRQGVAIPQVLGFVFPQPKVRTTVVADIMDESPATIPAKDLQPHHAEPIERAAAPVQVGFIDGKKMQGYRVYSPNAPGVTITSSGGGRARFTGAYAVAGGARSLTPREAYRMQGAPEWAAHHPVHCHAMRHAGNAVAIPIAREFARLSAAALRNSCVEVTQ